MVPTMFNSQSDNWCAYCKYHNCAMTYKQVRAKECLQKQCRHMIKRESHSVWTQRALVKEKRKARKEHLMAMAYRTERSVAL